MKAVGVVVEYNPFHNGHLYHIQMARAVTNADVVVACMSGNFLQRGEPALTSKWTRAKMALENGVDLVVELPYIYSTQKAELFAQGAVQILTELQVDAINFGSESGDASAFQQLIKHIDEHQNEYDHHIQEQLALGMSFPKAASEAFKLLNLPSSTLSLEQPNNILGYHYVRAIQESRAPIEITTTLRKQAHYHDEHVPAGAIASATSIRQALFSDKQIHDIQHVIPKSTYNELIAYREEYGLLHRWEHYFPLLQYKILSSSPAELRQLYECDEGIEYRLIETIKKATSFQQWMTALKTKRYTWTRLQRLATHILLNTKKSEMKYLLDSGSLPYIRLLGMNERGQAFLNATKKERHIPLLSKMKKPTHLFAEMEERINSIYYAPLTPEQRIIKSKEDLTHVPIRLIGKNS